jgi:sterol desaturase/sphingolipid hydroxylase (fatty acid hydroxylase superfamily)
MALVLSVLTPLSFFVWMIAEAIRPARPLPKVRFWRAKGIAFFFVAGAIIANAPGLWADFAMANAIGDLSALGTFGGAFVYLIAVSFFGYWYHRGRHKLLPLWRMHQLHHSAERLDVAGTFYHHPADAVVIAAIGSFTSMWLLGITADAAALGGFVGFQLEVLTHANVRTPRWLGYVVQRPEQHSVHHARGVHAFNYGLPMLMFGTFRNPERAEAKSGFWDGASRRLFPMLVGMDVTTPAAEAGRASRPDPARDRRPAEGGSPASADAPS